MEELTGVVESITYNNSANNFIVFKLLAGQEQGLVAVTGRLPVPFIGEHIKINGEWVEHSKFGRQFKAYGYRRLPISSEEGTERFLASGAVKGIGWMTAARIVKRFGAKALEVIEGNPQRLAEIPGIGKRKAAAIGKAYAVLAEFRELMLVLESCGVSGCYAQRIFAKYGPLSLEVLNKEPYRLVGEVEGIGFRMVDHMAMAAGAAMDDQARIAAGINYVLGSSAQAGHCCIPEELAINETARLLAVDRQYVRECLLKQLKDGKLLTEDYHGLVLIYPQYLYHAERFVSERLLTIAKQVQSASCEDCELEVQKWETSMRLALAKGQREAVAAALKHGILVLTGGPGTGKTTTVKGILAVIEAMHLKIVLAAPTGRAAKRLSDTTGREAATIHRLLEAVGGVGQVFARNEDNPLDADVVIVDEVSMLDIMLTGALLAAVPDGCRIVLAGDVDQLPAVGPGSVLKDIIRSGVIPVIKLTEVFRQEEESAIVCSAHRINKGLLPVLNESCDFEFSEVPDDKQAVRRIVALCRDELSDLGYDVWSDVQVLSPMHRYECGVENLNRLLQEALNPQDGQKPEAAELKQVFRSGDKVMQMKNNYSKKVFNGDIGYIAELDLNKLLVRYPENDVYYERSEYSELSLAYAMSVHKSQGSEYPVVILPLVASHKVMLQRSLLYTAVTRAKEKVIIIGSKSALYTAVANDKTRRRYSLLADRLRGEYMC